MDKKYLKLIIALSLAVAGSSCSSSDQPQQPDQDTAAVAPEDQPAEEVDAPFSYKKDTIERKFKTITVTMNVDFAKDGNEKLVKNINEYINKELGNHYKKEITDTKEVLAFYANYQLDKMREVWEEGANFTYDIRVLFSHETENYVSYTSSFFEYTGGAHGIAGNDGATFRKSDGQQLTWDMFNTQGNEFKQILKEGIKGYFEDAIGHKIKSDEDFKSYLLDIKDVNNLPLPSAKPYINKKGLVIHYGQYEIAPYASGQPEFVMPLANARKILKEPGFLF